MPLSRWSSPALARELAARCQVAAASASNIGRWLSADALKPWQHRSWISARDPEFAARAARVLDLYAGSWDGAGSGWGVKVGANVRSHRATSGDVWRALSQADGIPGYVRLRPATGWS